MGGSSATVLGGAVAARETTPSGMDELGEMRVTIERKEISPAAGDDFEALFSYFWHGEITTDFLRKSVGDFVMARHRLDSPRHRIAPQGMRTSFPL